MSHSSVSAPVAAMQEALDAWIAKTKSSYRSEPLRHADDVRATSEAAAGRLQSQRQRTLRLLKQQSAPVLATQQGSSSWFGRQGSKHALQQGKAVTHLAGVDAGINVARMNELPSDLAVAEAAAAAVRQNAAAAAATVVPPAAQPAAAAVVVASTSDGDQTSHTGQANSMAGPSGAGEVRLLIGSSADAPAQRQQQQQPRQQPEQQQQQMQQQQQKALPECLSRESVELADAAAAAAVAAAELAGAEEQWQGKQAASGHRLLRLQSFARQTSSSRLRSAAGAAAMTAAQAGMGTTASKRDTSQPAADHPGAPAANATQHQPADAATFQAEHCEGAAGPSRLGSW